LAWAGTTSTHDVINNGALTVIPQQTLEGKTMSDSNAPFAPVLELLGWKATYDKSFVLLGFKQPDNGEFAMGVSPKALDGMIVALVNATAAFPPAGLGEQTSFAAKVERVETGHTPSTGELFLRLRLATGGHLGFSLSPALAHMLREQLDAELGRTPMGPSAGTAMN
jgi:hypothetical protein